MPQRSPVIFWLLLAATLAVNAVVLSWMLSNPESVFAIVAFHSLCVSQLSVVCDWSAVAASKSVWTRIAPIVATLVATFSSITLIRQPDGLDVSFASFLAHYGLQAALVLAVLRLLQRTKFWRHIIGESVPLRYSVGQLLAAMTVVAVLAAAMRRSEFLNAENLVNVPYTCCYAALAVVGAIFWKLSQPWVIRFSGVVGVAILFAIALSLTETPVTYVFSAVISAHFVIQAIVLSVWFGLGPILPPSRETSSAS